MDKFSVIITAGGTSSRYGNTNKLLEKIFDKTVIEETVNKFLPFESVYEVIIPANKEFINEFKSILTDKKITIIEGGNSRQESVYKAAVSVMTKTTDTIKEVDKNGRIIRTIDRSKLYNTQTPQGFKTSLIKDAHEKLKNGNFTDDCSMLEELNVPVYIVNGSYKNIKITVKNDLDFAKLYI